MICHTNSELSQVHNHVMRDNRNGDTRCARFPHCRLDVIVNLLDYGPQARSRRWQSKLVDYDGIYLWPPSMYPAGFAAAIHIYPSVPFKGGSISSRTS